MFLFISKLACFKIPLKGFGQPYANVAIRNIFHLFSKPCQIFPGTLHHKRSLSFIETLSIVIKKNFHRKY